MRRIKYKINGTKTSDGAGVRLTRIIGSPELNMLDPFYYLMSLEVMIRMII